MKKTNKLMTLCLAVIFAVLLLSCSSDGDNGDTGGSPGGNETVETTLTIKNASSYTLYDVKWNGKSISYSGGIRSGNSEKRTVSEGFGYIYFSFYPNGGDTLMECYTESVMDIKEGDNASFTFTNNTIVVQLLNTGNKKTLDAIQFPSKATLSVVYDGRLVEKNDVIDLGSVVTNTSSSAEFELSNNGKNTLRFIGNAPVTSSDNCVTISAQPSASTLFVGTSIETFKIEYSSDAVGSYSSTISIMSNDETSPYTFTVTYRVKEPAPKLSVKFNEDVIENEGTVDFGSVPLGKDLSIEITLSNEGTKKLVLTGSPSVSFLNETTCFEIVSQPIPEISIGKSSKCTIKYTPFKEGEDFVVLKIASNDPENENMYIYLKGAGVMVYPEFDLSQNKTHISEGTTISVATKVRKDKTATGTFTIKNTSSEVDLHVSVKTGGTADTISVINNKEVIPPSSSGTFNVIFNPNNIAATFSETIILTTNCKETEFSFTVSFSSREFGAEANLFSIYDIGGTVNPSIAPSNKNYTITFDSLYDEFSIRLADIKRSEYASVYIDEMPLLSSLSFGINDGKVHEIKIVSEDESTENRYQFTFKSKENYDDTSFSKFYLKTTSNSELDITTSLASGIYYTNKNTFYLKPVLKNSNAKVYIGAQGYPVSQMQNIENSMYSSKVNLMDYSGVLKVIVVSESGLKMNSFSIIAE